MIFVLLNNNTNESAYDANLKLAEYHLYGSSAQGRFATWKPDNVEYDVTIYTPESSSTVNRVVSQKEFEVKDHLGNVRLVFSDLKDVNIGSISRDRYKLDVRAVNNYYPFGMLMPDMSL